jgi:hypothetical protein
MERVVRHRSLDEVTVVVVTKYVTVDAARAVIAAGATHLGENYIVPAVRKFDALAGYGLAFTRHLIGPVQTNKAPSVVGKFEWVQTLDRPKVVDALGKRIPAGAPKVSALIEVNIGREPQKSGCPPEEVAALAEHVLKYDRLALRGLMAIPPVGAPPDATRGYFAEMRRLFDATKAALGDAVPQFDTLSLGMTADFEAALTEGANMVRIGSAFFDGIPDEYRIR